MSLAKNCKICIIYQVNVCDDSSRHASLLTPTIRLCLFNVENVKFDELFQTQHAYGAIETRRNKSSLWLFLVIFVNNSFKTRNLPRVTLEHVHLLLGFPVSVPLVHLQIAQLRSHDKVVELGVEHQRSDIVLLARDATQHSCVLCVHLRTHTRMELVQVNGSGVPRAQLRSLQIKSQPFEPLAPARKLVIVTPNLFEVLNGDLNRVAFGVEQNCLPWRISILNVQLIKEDSFSTGSYKLMRFVNKDYLRDLTALKGQISDDIQIFVEDEELKIACDCKVEEVFGRVTNALDLTVCVLRNRTSLSEVAADTHFKRNFEQGLSRFRMPHIHTSLIV